MVRIEIYTGKPGVQLELWDSDSKITHYDDKFSEFSDISTPLHPSKLSDTVIRRLWSGFLSHLNDDYVVVVIAYSQVIFNACRIFKHDVHSKHLDQDVDLSIHVVDNSHQLFVAPVLNSGKIVAPQGCDIDGIFDEYDKALNSLLDLDTTERVYRNGVITDPLPDNERDCLTCAYEMYNWPEAGSLNRCTSCHGYSNYKQKHDNSGF